MLLSLTFVVLSIASCDAEQDQQSPLFAAGETRLSTAEMWAIHAIFATRFRLSDDGLRFEDENCGDVAPQTDVVDLNNDGASEVFVRWGNACTSGATGRSLSLFIRRDSGDYLDQFGFPAHNYAALSGKNAGYPDLQFGGPGFCFAVWAWREDHYEFKCNLPQEEGGCQFTGNVCQDY
jgi:hypothetical protein